MSTLLDAALGAFAALNDDEARDLEEVRTETAEGDPWSRRRPFHLTASAFVVHPASSRVLLRWHAHLRAWLQVGGHGDPTEVDPYAIALREAVEETGLGDLRSHPDGQPPRLIQVVAFDVPASGDEPAHRHGDLRYVLVTSTPDAIRPESTATPLRWVGFDAVRSEVTEANLLIGIDRTIAMFERFA